MNTLTKCFGLKILLAAALNLLSMPAYSKVAAVEIENGKALLITTDGQTERLDLPFELQKSRSYVIQLGGKAAPPEASPATNGALNSKNSQADSQQPPTVLDIDSLIFKANQMFHQKRFSEAIDLLDKADAADSKNVTVKNMKGSLFFLMGQKKQARAQWEKSLLLDANQPKVLRYIESIEQNSGEKK